MKKTVSILLALLFAFCSFGTVFAGTENKSKNYDYVGMKRSGDCGPNLHWEVKFASGSTEQYAYLKITGDGNMYDYSTNNLAPWYSDLDHIRYLQLGEGITSIGDYAFYNCGLILNLYLPNSLTRIGECAFEKCNSLTTVNITNGVDYIGDEAFRSCKSIKTVTIGNGLTEIGRRVFYLCTALTSVTIGNSVTKIGNSAFAGCTSLRQISIPDSRIISIDNSAFSGCSSLAFLTIPNSVTCIGEAAFINCSSLISVELSDSVNNIGKDAFRNCSSLSEATIPDSVTSIEEGTYYGCTSLTTVSIPDSIMSIGDGAFCDCTSLNEAIFFGLPPTSFGACVFDNCTTEFCIYYIPALAYEWAPNGETAWNGYPIAPANYATVTFTGVYNDTLLVQYGQNVELPIFDGEGVHYTFTVNGEPWDGTNITEDVTVEVGLDINVYNVTFVDSMTGEIFFEEQVRHGEAATAPEPPEHPAYEFSGWDIDFSNVKSDLVVNAVYDKVAFFVTFYDPMDDTVIETQVVYPGEAAVPPAPPEHYGYDFVEWQGDYSCVTEDVTVSAVYAPKKFVVRFTDGKGNIIDTQLVAYLTAAVEPEPPYAEPGEIFIGWDADFSCITGDLTVNALWEYVTVCTVTFTGAYTGTVVVNYGEACELPVYPSQYLHYTFMVDGEYWDGECVTSDVTVVVSAAANSIDCTVIFVDWDGTVLSTQTVRYGNPATPPEDPTREGCVFTGWSKNLEFIAHDVTIKAVYAKGPDYLAGDVDCDGLVTMADVTILAMYLNGENPQISVLGMLNADANDEWKVDVRDIAAIYKIINNS